MPPDTEGTQATLADPEFRPWEERGGVRYADDPTEAVLSESALNKKWLCDYVINVATGCRHGCRFCYVPSTPNIRTRTEMLQEHVDVDHAQDEWGDYVLHRDAERLARVLRGRLSRKRKWKETRGGRGIVALSFSTDCYQDATTADATRACVIELLRMGVPVRILTRNPMNAVQDLDVLEWGADLGLVTVGTSIPSLDRGEVLAIERRAPAPETRLQGLREIADAGVPTFVSMSPTYPTATRSDLRGMLERFDEELSTLDVVFHEALNPRGGNFQATVEAAEDAGETRLASKLAGLRDRETWLGYAEQQLRWVIDLGRDLDVPVNPWPGDVAERGSPEVAEWARGLQEAESPENFPFGADPFPEPVFEEDAGDQEAGVAAGGGGA